MNPNTSSKERHTVVTGKYISFFRKVDKRLSLEIDLSISDFSLSGWVMVRQLFDSWFICMGWQLSNNTYNKDVCTN